MQVQAQQVKMVSTVTFFISSTFFALTCLYALKKSSRANHVTGPSSGPRIGKFVRAPSSTRRVKHEKRIRVIGILNTGAKKGLIVNSKIGTEKSRRAHRIDRDARVDGTFMSSFGVTSREKKFEADLRHDLGELFPSSSPEPSVEPSDEPGPKLTSTYKKKGKVHPIMIVAFTLFGAIFIILCLKSMGTLEHCLEKHFLYNRFRAWEQTTAIGSSTPGVPPRPL